MTNQPQTKTQVLIVGGSLNGLTMALLLAHRNVKCIVVERHPGTSIQYKFRGISPRSMEIFRGLGIEEDIRAHRTGDQKSGQVVNMKNLSDHEIKWQGLPWADTEDISPTTAEFGTDLEDIENRWSLAYGVDADGAILVRPDGFIAWRAKTAVKNSEEVLRDVFERLSFRSTTNQGQESERK